MVHCSKFGWGPHTWNISSNYFSRDHATLRTGVCTAKENSENVVDYAKQDKISTYPCTLHMSQKHRKHTNAFMGAIWGSTHLMTWLGQLVAQESHGKVVSKLYSNCRSQGKTN